MPLNTSDATYTKDIQPGLNPCSNGMPLNTNDLKKAINEQNVSILVLMECL